jgi:hypothetical protein
MRNVLPLEKLQGSQLPEALNMLMQGGFEVFYDWIEFGPPRRQSLGAQFPDAVF